MALVTLFLLRGLSLGFKPTWRLAGIGAMALGLFILVGPVFKEARAIWQVQQDAGVPPLTALMDGIGEGTARFLRGEAGFSEGATNVAERGNAGVFFLSVAERHVPPQHGRMTWASILWVVPSVFITKPAEQVEAMIQLLANMRIIDDANSIPLVFYVDFGALGMFIAGAYCALLLYCVARLFARAGQFGIFEVVALGVFFSLSFSIENELSGQFAELRNLALFAPVAFFTRFLASGAHKRNKRRMAWLRSPALFRPEPAPVAPAGFAGFRRELLKKDGAAARGPCGR